MGGSAVVGAEAFRRGSGFATGARPWLRSSSPLLSKRHTRWRVRSDANSAEVTRYVDQCVPVKLEKVPMELLILLLEKDGHLVTRQQIIERLWGNDVFVDTEHGINTAIRKIRQALKDDSDQPRFVQTVKGKGYRFVAAVRSEEHTPELQSPCNLVCRLLLEKKTFCGRPIDDLTRQRPSPSRPGRAPHVDLLARQVCLLSPPRPHTVVYVSAQVFSARVQATH